MNACLFHHCEPYKCTHTHTHRGTGQCFPEELALIMVMIRCCNCVKMKRIRPYLWMGIPWPIKRRVSFYMFRSHLIQCARSTLFCGRSRESSYFILLYERKKKKEKKKYFPEQFVALAFQPQSRFFSVGFALQEWEKRYTHIFFSVQLAISWLCYAVAFF